MKTTALRLSIALLFFGFFKNTSAQHRSQFFGTIYQFYRLTDAEAAAIFRGEKNFDPRWLHTLADTSHNRFEVSRLPPGHYLRVQAIGESAVVNLHSVNTLRAELLRSPRDFLLTLSDSLGQAVLDARVFLSGKQVFYDEKTKAYRLKNRARGGFLEIYGRGESQFFQVKPEGRFGSKGRQWLAWRSNFGLGKIITAPIRLVKTEIYKLKNPRRRWGRRNRYFDRSFQGYIALSQPKYQPGDTLRIKAFLANDRGRPRRRPVRVEIAQNYGREQPVFSKKISPHLPGSFVLDLPLSDTFDLDERYWVRFSNFKKNNSRRARSLPASFFYEDYQLDEVKCALAAERDRFEPDETVRLNFDARDANGQPVFDGALLVLLRAGYASNFRSDEMTVADTLWLQKIPLSGAVETPILVPDSIFPAAELQVRAEAFFTNSAGELQRKEAVFTINRGKTEQKTLFLTKVENGWLSADWNLETRKNDLPDAKTPVELIEYWRGKKSPPRQIVLPFREPIKTGISGYVLKYGKMEQSVWLGDHGLTVGQFRAGDTAVFLMKNPHKIAVRVWVSRDRKMVFEGLTSDSVWRWSAPGDRSDFVFQYAFEWAGEPIFSRVENYASAQNLKIEMEQPELAFPGEKVQVKIRATDSKNRPARGVNLASGATNAQFEETERPYAAPRIRWEKYRKPLVFNELKAEKIDVQGFNFPLDTQWFRKLELDSFLYYRLRFRGRDGLYGESYPVKIEDLPPSEARPQAAKFALPNDSFYLNRPQYAPFVFKNHIRQPVHLIFFNGKLAYFSGTTDRPPYSFYGWYGYNQIQLRTAEGLWTLDSVWLERGQKLELALDADRAPGGSFPNLDPSKRPLRVRFEPRTEALTTFEQQLLKNSMLLFRPKVQTDQVNFFWQYADNIHSWGNPVYKTTQIFGPFAPGQEVVYLRPGAFLSRFKFDPGFEYEIFPTRERLYEARWPQQFFKLPQQAPAQEPGRLAIGPHHVLAQPPANLQPKRAFGGSDAPGRGKLQIALERGAVMGFALATKDTVLGLFTPGHSVVRGLKPGRYEVYFLKNIDSCALRRVVVRADTLSFYRFQNLDFQPNTLPERVFKIIMPSPTEPPDQRQWSPQPSYFSQWPGAASGGVVLEGLVRDEDDGETLIGATVKILQGGVLVAGTITDFNGAYRIALPMGVYDVEVAYTGYSTQRTTGVVLAENQHNALIISMSTSGLLQEAVVVGFSVPLIERDRTMIAQAASYYYIDGIRVSGAVAEYSSIGWGGISPELTLREQLLPGTQNLFGVKTEMKFGNYSPTFGEFDGLPPEKQRGNFNDHAWWQPQLLTDARGEAVFSATLPDNITAWDAYALGMDKRGRAGLATRRTRAFKPLLGQVFLPRFAVAGDSFEALGRATNFTGDSLSVKSVFRVNDLIISEKEQRIGNGSVDFFEVKVPDGSSKIVNFQSHFSDSLKLEFDVSASAGKRNFADGERREIAIRQPGTLENEGQFLLLESDTSLELGFDPTHGPVHLRVQSNALDLLLDDVEFLKNYPYACLEQTAGRLLALLLEKRIRQQLGEPFRHEKKLNESLARLRKSQLPDGSWGWWPGSQSNAWMTVYVLRALREAETAGYPTRTQTEKGVIWLRQNWASFSTEDQLNALIFLRLQGLNVPCEPTLMRLDSLASRSPQLHRDLSRLRLRQLCGLPVTADSLKVFLQKTTHGGLFAGLPSRSWHDRQATNTLLAYDVAAAVGSEEICRGIRRFWLESRVENGSRNTVETAQILVRLLPEVLKKVENLSANRLVINDSAQILTFPYSAAFSAKKTLRLKKSGVGPLYLGVWQQWQNVAPEPRSDVFSVKSWLEQGGRRADSLRVGEAATLVVEVDAHSASEYVLVEAPIPAACGYGEKAPARWPESHREHFHDRTLVFFEKLPLGRTLIRIGLEPRFAGRFTLNPARVEEMYFPMFFGRNEARKVGVGRL